MKTTIEIPDVLFRRAKSKAAERGQQGFGKLRQLQKELVTRQIRRGPPAHRA